MGARSIVAEMNRETGVFAANENQNKDEALGRKQWNQTQNVNRRFNTKILLGRTNTYHVRETKIYRSARQQASTLLKHNCVASCVLVALSCLSRLLF